MNYFKIKIVALPVQPNCILRILLHIIVIVIITAMLKFNTYILLSCMYTIHPCTVRTLYKASI